MITKKDVKKAKEAFEKNQEKLAEKFMENAADADEVTITVKIDEDRATLTDKAESILKNFLNGKIKNACIIRCNNIVGGIFLYKQEAVWIAFSKSGDSYEIVSLDSKEVKKLFEREQKNIFIL